ncbi:hypothetical protein DFH06DRAFT_1146755 [Mycena polygramma]|nr:hypothetical protein DFH06DRAFT_1146755 [Mycena polygramma]
MHLLELHYDVLLRTFKFLDVKSILRSSGVCSAFRTLAQSKHVWLAVVHNLASRNLLAVPPQDVLLGYTATQLVEEVKRAMFGPYTWDAASPRPPAVLRHIHVSMPGPSESSVSEPALLAGDRHLLVSRGTACEIWDIAENRRLWVRDGVIRSDIIVRPVGDGTQIFIAMWSPRPSVHARNPDQLDCKIVVQTHVLDLITKSERPLLTIQLPRNFTKFSGVVMGGDFWVADVEWRVLAVPEQPPDYMNRPDLLCDFDPWRGGIIIVNWRDHTFVLVRGLLTHKNLLPGHLIASTIAEGAQVVLHSWAAFDAQWQPLNSSTLAEAANSPLRVEPAVLQRVEYPSLPGWRTPFINVHECPLNHGSYVVSTHKASSHDLPAGSAERLLPSLHRYRLTLPTSSGATPITAPPLWKKISSSGAINRVLMGSLTYAGFGVAAFLEGLSLAPTRFVGQPTTAEKAQDVDRSSAGTQFQGKRSILAKHRGTRRLLCGWCKYILL